MILKRPARIWVICILLVLYPPSLYIIGMSRYALLSAPFYVIIALGFLFVRKWSWYTSISGTAALLVLNSIEMFRQSFLSGVYLLIANIILLFTGFALFRKELMAPYFFPRLRWWESEERIRTQLLGDLRLGGDSFHGEISDISLSGCFVELSDPVDEAVSRRKPVLTVNLRSKKLSLPVIIMRLIRNGYGVGCMFSAKALQYKGHLEHLIRELLSEDASALEIKSLAEERFIRAKAGLKGFVIIQGISYPVKVLDVSTHGARISVGEDVAELLELSLFHIEFHGIVIEVDAKIRHARHQEDSFIVGLELFHSFQSSIQTHRLIAALKHAGYETVVRRGSPADHGEKRRLTPIFPFLRK